MGLWIWWLFKKLAVECAVALAFFAPATLKERFYIICSVAAHDVHLHSEGFMDSCKNERKESMLSCCCAGPLPEDIGPKMKVKKVSK
jgi:hypothetical protein